MNDATAWHKRLIPIVFVTTLLVLACFSASPAYAAEGNVAESLPASFDLRDVDGRCYVTPVKFQNPFGTCWGFAAMSAAETSVLGSHLADDPNAYKTLDFSEKQLAYFAQSHIDDPASSQNGEGMFSNKYKMVDGRRTLTEPLVSGDFYNTGGSTFLATNSFAAGIGPTIESADESLVYRGKKGLVQSSRDGSIPRYCYSADDDWTLEQDLRFMQDYVLKEAYFLPNPARIDEETSAYQYNPEGTAAIKEQLMQIRGVSICYQADTAMPGQAASTMFISDKWAHYTYKLAGATHAVTIIGWDDNYSAGNFRHEVYQLKDPRGGYKEENYLTDEDGNYVVDEEATAQTVPPANGAWLCKNSWGSGEREFPNRGAGDWGIPVQKTDADGNPVVDENGEPVMVGSGYFWLSYYDQSLGTPESFVFATDIIARGGSYNRNTLHCNQYDLMPVFSMGANENDELIKSANVFTAKTEEILLAVSDIAKTPNTTVTVDVYLLNDGFTTPEDGYLVTSVTQAHELAGFYITYLDDVAVDLVPGQSYSVVVTQKLASGKYVVDYPTGLGPDSELADLGGSTSYSVAVQNDESYIYSDGAWGSWANEAVRDEFLKLNEESAIGEGVTKKKLEQAQDTVYDNFPIKVYAFDPQGGVYARLAGGAERLSVCVGEQGTTAELELYGPNSEGLTIADFANSERGTNEWVLESGSENLVQVVPSADGTSAQIRGLAPGTAYVVAHVWGIGRVIIPVDVHEHKWGVPTYEWSSDNSACTATRVCEYDASHVEVETVAATASGTTLTVTFKNPAFEPQSKTVEAPADGSADQGHTATDVENTTKPTSPQTSAKMSATAKATSLPKTGDATAAVAVTSLLVAGMYFLLVGMRRARL
ncbi:MAG: hypothetical protein J6D54_06655 [Olsenella sp.]|nr:hypothetical protein [Olsenella sp.]